MSIYQQRGVSAQKEEVHQAIKNLDQGLFPHAFCKLYPDFLGNNPDFINISHADGAGTKSVLAYLYWKATGDYSVWQGIAQDAIVMNLDDLLCVGIYNNILFSSTIDRNKGLIDGKILENIIQGSQLFFDNLKKMGIHIHYLGGETADLGDLVRTIAVNGTMTARWQKNKIISNEKIAPKNVIVGFASYGQAGYETAYNSGIGSNGLTSARHDILNKYYYQNFPESFDPNMEESIAYIGKNSITDKLEIKGKTYTVGQLLLSPTRSYAPIIKPILENYFDKINGMIHCSGGGQTKCLKYLPRPMKIVKNNLLPIPPIFEMIQNYTQVDFKEMFQVFNMGHRLEIFTDENTALELIKIAKAHTIEAQIIGYVEPANKKELTIEGSFGTLNYTP